MSIISSSTYNILINEDAAVLSSFIDQLNASSIFVIVDQNTESHCLPKFKEHVKMNFTGIRIPAGEQYKNLDTCRLMWEALLKNNCDRNSLVINLGGGVVGDMGGFVAASYMRGVRFIQAPTSLLSQVDASVGGKLGIDFMNYKNMIGYFANPEMVWIDTDFLNTLDERQVRSGFAEMLKHALISSAQHWNDLKNAWPLQGQDNHGDLIEQSINIKNRIVTEDFRENGIRKILNFGHSIGHAVESVYLQSDNNLLHGEAIAIGMICEAQISYQKSMLKASELKEINSTIRSIFADLSPVLSRKADDIYKVLISDKKNKSNTVRMSLLNKIGGCQFDVEVQRDEFDKAIAYFENSNEL